MATHTPNAYPTNPNSPHYRKKTGPKIKGHIISWTQRKKKISTFAEMHIMTTVGFEPTPLARVECNPLKEQETENFLESTALDRSAKSPV